MDRTPQKIYTTDYAVFDFFFVFVCPSSTKANLIAIRLLRLNSFRNAIHLNVTIQMYLNLTIDSRINSSRLHNNDTIRRIEEKIVCQKIPQHASQELPAHLAQQQAYNNSLQFAL